MSIRTGLWWERNDFCYKYGRLTFAGRDVGELSARALSPAFFYSAARVEENVKHLSSALENIGLKYRIFYALKANRFQPLLTFMKLRGLCGVDICSPAELGLAVSCGFHEDDISYTGTSVSNDDLDIILRYPQMVINCDSMSMIRRIGERLAGRKLNIGIRINPALGTGYGENKLLRYSGAKPTKFGIYKEQYEEALDLAESYGLTVQRLHFHTGCGYLNAQLPVWDQILEACRWFADKTANIKAVNVGGGWAFPIQPGICRLIFAYGRISSGNIFLPIISKFRLSREIMLSRMRAFSCLKSIRLKRNRE